MIEVIMMMINKGDYDKNSDNHTKIMMTMIILMVLMTMITKIMVMMIINRIKMNDAIMMKLITIILEMIILIIMMMTIDTIGYRYDDNYLISAWTGDRFWTGLSDSVGLDQYRYEHSRVHIWGPEEPNFPMNERCVLMSEALELWNYPCIHNCIHRVCEYVPIYWCCC